MKSFDRIIILSVGVILIISVIALYLRGENLNKQNNALQQQIFQLYQDNDLEKEGAFMGNEDANQDNDFNPISIFNVGTVCCEEQSVSRDSFTTFTKKKADKCSTFGAPGSVVNTVVDDLFCSSEHKDAVRFSGTVTGYSSEEAGSGIADNAEHLIINDKKRILIFPGYTTTDFYTQNPEGQIINGSNPKATDNREFNKGDIVEAYVVQISDTEFSLFGSSSYYLKGM